MTKVLSWISCSNWWPVSRPVNHCMSANGGVKRSKSYHTNIVTPENTSPTTKIVLSS